MSLAIDDLINERSGDREPLLGFYWKLDAFPSIGGHTLPSSYCEEIDLPFPAFNTQQKELAGTTITFPGNTSIDGFEMTLYVDSLASSIVYIQDWQSLIQNPLTGGYRTPSHYWKDLTVRLHNTKGATTVVSNIKNVWPISISPPRLNQDTNRLQANVQFACTAQIFIPSKRI